MSTPSLRGRSVLCGLIGSGVKPSLTPELHEREAERHGLRYVYKTIDLRSDEADEPCLRQLLDGAIRLGYDGLNVTHPVKQVMVGLVDEVSDAVRDIGALNTVLIRDGRTTGHNTDVTGFARSVSDGLADADMTHVVLLGAGGAGTAVAHALAGLGVGRLDVVDPAPARVATLAASVSRAHSRLEVTTLDPAGVGETLRTASGVVNATPVGMAAHPGTPFDTAHLHERLWVADIVYRPLVTELVSAARRTGCAVLSGAGMAVYQAVEAFELFTGELARPIEMFADFDEMVAAEAQPADRSTHALHAPSPHPERNM